MSQKCCDDYKVHYKLAMGGAPQVVRRVASQIWQVVFASQTLQVFLLALRKKAQYVVVLLCFFVCRIKIQSFDLNLKPLNLNFFFHDEVFHEEMKEKSE
jgi:hypothetical protein